ncbi:HNH endonuclease [Blastochloris tepida]|uniref:Restriction endonuclease n=1 Tax=Blastochloris tepida TaxID=2233851 RepID=A0A348G1D2_9HYPH|nr:HNH endonuclease [Blastochloris tepida]BBF93365.1 restriction endonuclease [Blastochloris tepida]
MPTAPPSYRPPRAAVAEHVRKAEHDAKRRRTQPWRALYNTPQWRAIREQQLAEHPLCERCEARGLVVAATVVNHVVRHRGDPVTFFGGPFESLCKHCHDSEVQSEERRAEINASGASTTCE